MLFKAALQLVKEQTKKQHATYNTVWSGDRVIYLRTLYGTVNINCTNRKDLHGK